MTSKSKRIALLGIRHFSERMAEPMMPPNTGAVLAELQELTADGKLLRDPLGDDALWRAAV